MPEQWCINFFTYIPGPGCMNVIFFYMTGQGRKSFQHNKNGLVGNQNTSPSLNSKWHELMKMKSTSN